MIKHLYEPGYPKYQLQIQTSGISTAAADVDFYSLSVQSFRIYCPHPDIVMPYIGGVRLRPWEHLEVCPDGKRYIIDFEGNGVENLPLKRPRYGLRPKEHPTTCKGNKKPQIVWPRDKKQKGAHTWDRLTDIFTGKGPDIWIGRKYSTGPHRPVWSGWETPWIHPEDDLVWGNLGYPYRNVDTVRPAAGAHRGKEEKYDFRSRKYMKPRAGVWSDVKWSNQKPHVPLYHRDRDGYAVVEPEFDEGRFNSGSSRNPFAFNERTPEWDWNVGDARGW